MSGINPRHGMQARDQMSTIAKPHLMCRFADAYPRPWFDKRSHTCICITIISKVAGVVRGGSADAVRLSAGCLAQAMAKPLIVGSLCFHVRQSESNAKFYFGDLVGLC